MKFVGISLTMGERCCLREKVAIMDKEEHDRNEAKMNKDFKKSCVKLRESVEEVNRLAQHLVDLGVVVHFGLDPELRIFVAKVNGMDTRWEGFGKDRNTFAFDYNDEGGIDVLLPERFIGDELLEELKERDQNSRIDKLARRKRTHKD